MAFRCGDSDVRLYLEDEFGVYRDVRYACMKPRCDNCWRDVHRVRMGILRRELNKLGIEYVWVGLIATGQRSGVRSFKERNKDQLAIPVMNVLTTYQSSVKCGLLATCNMIPSNLRVLKKMTVHEGVTVYEGWGLKYRPNRVTSDWELVHPGKRHGKFLGTKETIQQVQYLLNERHGYKPGERPEDPYLYESRLYEALRIVLERQTRSDDDMYS